MSWVVEKYRGAGVWKELYRGTKHGALCVRTNKKRNAMKAKRYNDRFRVREVSP